VDGQRAVDGFDRARYDGDRTVEEFGARLRDEFDSAATAEELLGLVHRTMAPGSLAITLLGTAVTS
jgi:hypothetical protein